MLPRCPTIVFGISVLFTGISHIFLLISLGGYDTSAHPSAFKVVLGGRSDHSAQYEALN